MKANGLMETMSRNMHILGMKAQKVAPGVMVVGGVIGLVGAAVMACKATTKALPVIEESKRKLNTLKEASEKPEELPEGVTVEDCKSDAVKIVVQTGLQLAKVYAVPVGIGVVSVVAILAGHKITHNRNVALAAAYAGSTKAFEEYRNRVIERFGEELDKELKYDLKKKEIEEIVVDEDGSESVNKQIVTVASPTGSEYSVIYDDGCKGWTKNPCANKTFLFHLQNSMTDRLRLQGYLFLNDVYDALGIPRTKAGQIVGWVYNEKNPIGDNYVDFGLFDVYRESTRNFMNGFERNVLLDFNVDGNILDLI